MSISINGATGISGVDGTSTAPAFTGADTDTGIFFQDNTVVIATDGSPRLAVDPSGNVAIFNFLVDPTGKVGISESNPSTELDLNGVYASNVVDLGTDNFTVDCSQGNYFTQLTNSTNTFDFTNVPSSRSYSFVLEVRHTTGTIAWPTEVKWPGGNAPQLSTGKDHLFVFSTDDGGSCFRGTAVVDYGY